MEEIENNILLKEKYENWTSENQNDFLDMCTGVRGLKLLYDGFFKEIMNPEYHPERLNDFLSQMLRQEVRIVKILPTDSTRIADESSLLIMDIVVELEDESIANVEMQKIGYLLPGQRSACYSADLLLRQYKRVKSRKKENFHYYDIKNVYTIVLFEKSPKEFHRFPMKPCHFFEQKSDTGLEMELLQKYLFIPLDIFLKNRQNINEIKKREAWLFLLSDDDPNTVIELIDKYPEFRGIYEEGYEICRNVEGVMEMFSKELYELDKNTVQYMIDEMQDTIDKQENIICELKQGIKAIIGFMRESKIPEEEIRKHLIDEYQLSAERAEELLNFGKA